jgi:hypothetical protein
MASFCVYQDKIALVLDIPARLKLQSTLLFKSGFIIIAMTTDEISKRLIPAAEGGDNPARIGKAKSWFEKASQSRRVPRRA